MKEERMMVLKKLNPGKIKYIDARNAVIALMKEREM